ncbi:M23 family metallopeptidase [Oceanobacillus piezotolerans]|uniref:M23 family metallopeptidase n=1 Tax=Oceanobacillus piezotolerans TaxID=2448030 RepID=A0A498D8P6_9BACI|nr:M23 family metallopeptidase [Oceanobacillus piezotolerans]RLL42923.1 M23 family metallopeptidase [Oceanobacillus piezotolerans]
MNENKGTPKNKWSQIFRKKWFFPALYLTIAALLLAGVIWYQNIDNQIPEATDSEQSEDYAPTPNEEAAEPVIEQQEVIQMPLEDLEQAEIVTKFFDYNASQEEQEAALVFYNNRYYQSTGVDIASIEGAAFDVLASLSGTVSEVKEDPLLGNVVALTHDEGVVTYYASLDEVAVTAGDEVKQGEKVGTAGKNLFGKDNGTHVHFEIRKDGQEVNPESYFNQPVGSLNSEEGQEVNEESEATETEAKEGTEEKSTEAEETEASEEQTNAEESTDNEKSEADESTETEATPDESSDDENADDSKDETDNTDNN